MTTERPATGIRIGAILRIAQLIAFPVEFLAIALARAPYSLVDNTLSDLGAVGCGTVAYPGLDVPVCSPAHPLFNASLLVGSLMVAVGAFLLLPVLGRPRARATAATGVVFIVIAQLSGMATALVPLDVDLDLHALVSAPVFVAQPLGLLLLGVAGWRNGRWWGISLVAVGAATLVVGVFFLVRLDPAFGGLLERLILWPATVSVAVIGADVLRQARRRVSSHSADSQNRRHNPGNPRIDP